MVTIWDGRSGYWIVTSLIGLLTARMAFLNTLYLLRDRLRCRFMILTIDKICMKDSCLFDVNHGGSRSKTINAALRFALPSGAILE